MIKVLFIDDELPLRRAWEHVLATQSDMRMVGTMPHADGLDEAVEAWLPDVVVMDLSMPGVDSLRALRRLTAGHPRVKTIVYSAYSDVAIMRDAYEAGAWAYVDKLTPPAEVLSIIRSTERGKSALSA